MMLKWILESPFWRCDVCLRIFGFGLIADLSYGNTEIWIVFKRFFCSKWIYTYRLLGSGES